MTARPRRFDLQQHLLLSMWTLKVGLPSRDMILGFNPDPLDHDPAVAPPLFVTTWVNLTFHSLGSGGGSTLLLPLLLLVLSSPRMEEGPPDELYIIQLPQWLLPTKYLLYNWEPIDV